MNRILSYNREEQLIAYVIWLMDSNNQMIEPIETSSSIFPIIFRKRKELFNENVNCSGFQYVSDGA